MIFSIEVRFVSVGKIRMIRSAPVCKHRALPFVGVVGCGSPGAKVAGEMFSSPTNPEGLPVIRYVHGLAHNNIEVLIGKV